MILRPPRATRTDTPCPYPTRFRSHPKAANTRFSFFRIGGAFLPRAICFLPATPLADFCGFPITGRPTGNHVQLGRFLAASRQARRRTWNPFTYPSMTLPRRLALEDRPFQIGRASGRERVGQDV